LFIGLLIGLTASATTATKNLDITVVHNSGASQTLLPMIQPPSTVFQFVAGTGSANTSIGLLVPAAIFPPGPAFAGTWAISGPDASKFTINPTTGVVGVGGADIACTPSPCSFSMIITVSQTGVAGSPASTPITLQGIAPSDTSTVFLALDNYAPAPGSTINVKVKNTPNVAGKDYVHILLPYPRGYSNFNDPAYVKYIGGIGVHNATVSLTVPNPPTDNYQFLDVILVPNDSQPAGAIATTPTMLVPPSQTFVMSTAPNTLPPPFTPSQTLTVCPVGCEYTELSLAIAGLSNSNHSSTADNVLITMQAGAYLDCAQFGNNSPFTPPTDDRIWHLPRHLWIKGIGGGFAHLEGMKYLTSTCQGKGMIVFWGNTGDILTLDNLEISDWHEAGPTGGVYGATGSITMRNVYIHDGENGVITANALPQDFIIQNSRFARNGGAVGPQHNLYIGETTNTFLFDHSITEQALYGHALKTRAFVSTVRCSQLRGSQDAYFIDSEEADFAEGREAHLDNNTIVKGIGSTQGNQIGWALDQENGMIAGHQYSLELSSNILIDDDPVSALWFVYIAPPRVGVTGNMTSPPYTWSNNTFVGGPVGNTFRYYSYHSDSQSDPSLVTEVGDRDFANRTAAQITQTYPPPTGCSGTIGNMSVP
jgi:hypothetical protein